MPPFALHRTAHLPLCPAVRMTRGATGFGFFSGHFQKAGFTNGPRVPSCHRWLPCVILHLLTVTTVCPTEGFLKLLAFQSFDSLHLPLLCPCTHPHPLPLLVLSMQGLDGAVFPDPSFMLSALPCYRAKLMLGKGVVNEDFVLFIQLGSRERGKVLISLILSCQYRGA